MKTQLLLAVALIVLGGSVLAADVDLHVKEWYPKNNHFVFVCADDFGASSYDWQYGDGQQQLSTPHCDTYHVFNQTGEYTVECTARSGNESASDSLAVSVNSIRPVSQQPVDPTPGSTFNLAVKEWYPQGNDYIFVCGEGGADHYDYIFGDGEQNIGYSSHEVFYRYATPGEYTVECRAWSGDAAQSDTLHVSVSAQDISGVDESVADVQVTSLSATPWVLAPPDDAGGGNLYINTTISNGGGATSSLLRYLLSRDDVPGENDLVLTERIVDLAAGASASYTETVSVTKDMPAGIYHVIAVSDAADAIEETDELNNIMTAQTFIASHTLDPDYAPAANPESSVRVQLAQDFPQEHNYVFECIAEGFAPTVYNWTFSDGTNSTVPIFDVFHAFPGNGTYTATCTATDGVNTASADISVDVTTPLTLQQIRDSSGGYDPGYINSGFNRFDEYYAIWLHKLSVEGNTITFACDDVGYNSALPIYWSLPQGATMISSQQNGRIVNITVQNPGNYQFVCSAGTMGSEKYMANYYIPNPYIYHKGSSNGAGVAVNVTVAGIQEANAIVEIERSSLSADHNAIFSCNVNGFTPTQFIWDFTDRDRHVVRSAMRTYANGSTGLGNTIMHTFLPDGPGNYSYDVTCTATNGTHATSKSYSHSFEWPYWFGIEGCTQSWCTDTDRFEDPWMFTTIEHTVEGSTADMTCKKIGFLSGDPIGWNIDTQGSFTTNGTNFSYTFPENRTYSTICAVQPDLMYSHVFYYDDAETFARGAYPITANIVIG